MSPFDLTKALAGHPLVTRDGKRVLRFFDLEDGDAEMPYRAALDDGYAFYYTAEGEAKGFGGRVLDPVTLFLADEPQPEEPALPRSLSAS